eukprot:gene5170-8776_t
MSNQEYLNVPNFDEDESPLSPTREHSNAQLLAEFKKSSQRKRSYENLDLFFQRVYQYFIEKGFLCVVSLRITKLLRTVVILILFNFIFLIINWSNIRECKSNECFNSISNIFLPSLSLYKWFIQICSLFLIGYFIYQIIKYFKEIKNFYSIKKFYNEDLKIDEDEMRTIEWSEIIDKIVKIQDVMKLSTHKKLTSLDILNRIMRKENYLIGLFDKNVLNLFSSNDEMGVDDVGIGIGDTSNPNSNSNSNSSNQFLSKSLLYNLKLILNFTLEEDEFLIKKDLKVENLKYFIFKLIILNLILSPFIFLYILFENFLKYFIEYKNSNLFTQSILFNRKWTRLSKWKLRQYNELDHYFRFRLNTSHKLSIEYLNQFPNQFLSIIFKFLSFFFSSISTLILLFSLFQNNLFNFTIFGNNLFYYLTLFLIFSNISKNSIIEKNENFDPNKKLNEIMKIIEFEPNHWKNKAHKSIVKNEFESMFQFHWKIFFYEIFSIFLTPYILYTSILPSTQNILKFLKESTIEIKGVGHVCIYSAFNVKNKIDEKLDEKLENSIHNFNSHYSQMNQTEQQEEEEEEENEPSTPENLDDTNLNFVKLKDMEKTNEIFIDLDEKNDE